jgi:hypothetical protein
MTILAEMELHLPASSWVLSARRLWEFGEYGQPLDLRISSRTLASQAIDVVDCSTGQYLLTGFTLHDVEEGRFPDGLDRRLTVSAAVRSLQSSVKGEPPKLSPISSRSLT